MCLVLLFCDAACILFQFQFDFFGLIFIIIYVGAIAVLFLFIIMMLNIKIKKKISNSLNNFLFIIISSYIFALCIHENITAFIFFNDINFEIIIKSNVFLFIDTFTNIEVFGQFFYNYFNFFFLLSGVILLVALVGGVVLTTQTKHSNAKPNKEIDFKQLSRNRTVHTHLK